MGDTTRSSSRSYLTLDPQSSLEEQLAGIENRVLTPAAQSQIEEMQAQIEHNTRYGLNTRAQERKIQELQEDPRNYDVSREGGYLQESFQDLVRLAESEENIGDIFSGRQAQLDLASYLENLSAPEAPTLRGPLPGQEEMGYAQSFARDIFAPQQTQLNQLFQDQRMQANRTAAIQGRAGNDPVLLSNLAEEQARQQTQLGSQQTSLAAQTARELPFQFNQVAQQGYQNQMNNLLQNVQFQTQGAAVRQDLGNQALRNRLAVLGMGQSLLGGERQFRLATAQQNQETKQSTSPGALSVAGGIAGGVGAIAPLFTGMPSLQGLAGLQSQQQFAQSIGNMPQMSQAPMMQMPSFGQSNPYQPSFTPSLNWR